MKQKLKDKTLLSGLVDLLRVRYSVPQQVVFEIQKRFPVVAEPFDLDEAQHEQLAHKLFMFWRNRIISTEQHVVAVLHAFPECLSLGNKLSIKKAFRKFDNLTGSCNHKSWEDLSDRDEVPMIVETELSDGHHLVRLFTRKHFIENSDILNHCLGHSSLDRYFAKSRAGKIQVFSVIRANSIMPVATIIYDGEAKAIKQIKQAGDTLLTGVEDHFRATFEAIRFLVTTPTFSPSGKYKVLDICQILDLEEITSLFAINCTGEILSLDQVVLLSSENILGGSMVRVTSDMSLDILRTFSKCLSVDMTSATDEQRLSLTHLNCSLVDNRDVVDGYDNLRIVEGQVVCTGKTSAIFKALDRTGRGIYCKNMNKVSFPELVKIRGRLDVRSAKVLGAEKLTEVAGNIQTESVDKINLPFLKKLGWHLSAQSAKSIFLPVLIEHGGEILLSQKE